MLPTEGIISVLAMRESVVSRPLEIANAWTLE